MVVGVGSKSISGIFIEVIEQLGWQWNQYAPNNPTQAFELGTFEYVKQADISTREMKSGGMPESANWSTQFELSLSRISPIAVAGGAAGVVSTLACHPLEVLKDPWTVSRDVYPSLSIAISRIYKDGGIGAFYAGISPMLIGMLPYSTCFYFMYEMMKTSFCKSKNKKSLNRPEMLVLGALADFMDVLPGDELLWNCDNCSSALSI